MTKLAIYAETSTAIESALNSALETLEAIDSLDKDKDKASVVQAYIRAKKIADLAAKVQTAAKDIALAYMEENSLGSISGGGDTLAYKAPYEQLVFNQKDFKAKNASLYEEYRTQVKHFSASLVVKP